MLLSLKTGFPADINCVVSTVCTSTATGLLMRRTGCRQTRPSIVTALAFQIAGTLATQNRQGTAMNYRAGKPPAIGERCTQPSRNKAAAASCETPASDTRVRHPCLSKLTVFHASCRSTSTAGFSITASKEIIQ